jgi:hypothetical protein
MMMVLRAPLNIRSIVFFISDSSEIGFDYDGAFRKRKSRFQLGSARLGENIYADECRCHCLSDDIVAFEVWMEAFWQIVKLAFLLVLAGSFPCAIEIGKSNAVESREIANALAVCGGEKAE